MTNKFRKWLWDSGTDLAILPAITICLITWICWKYPMYDQSVGYTITVTQGIK